MIALKFYLPSHGEDEDEVILKDLWDAAAPPYMIFVRRISFRGNPYIKGVFMLKDEDALVPSEIVCVPLSDDCVDPLVNEFREELAAEKNGVELGSLV